MSFAIQVERASKSYHTWSSPGARLTVPLWERLGRFRGLSAPARDYCLRRAAKQVRHFHALRDVSFQVGRGESVGIIGRNGAGKSTLLQIIAGTLAPTAGSVEVQGRVTALLELGTGFNGEFTGRENVHMTCSVYGLSPAQTAAKMEEILDFAEVGDFVDQPVKTYSSGMMLRLAFSVHTALDPDVLIVDEALAVGDIFFQSKCVRLLQKRLASGMSLLLVSHDPGSIKALCQRALVLHRGEAAFLGESSRAVSVYEEIAQNERMDSRRSAVRADVVKRDDPLPPGFPPEAELVKNWPTKDEVGSREAEFIHARCVGVDGLPCASSLVGDPVWLEFYFRAHTDLDKPVLGFQIADRFGHVVYGLCSGQGPTPARPFSVQAGALGCWRVELPGRLGGGDYLVDATLGLGDRGDGAVEHHLHRVGGILALSMRYDGMKVDFFGPADLGAKITHQVSGVVEEAGAEADAAPSAPPIAEDVYQPI
jgi:lipopolysaccharide transport system ATP-binding protein